MWFTVELAGADLVRATPSLMQKDKNVSKIHLLVHDIYHSNIQLTSYTYSFLEVSRIKAGEGFKSSIELL